MLELAYKAGKEGVTAHVVRMWMPKRVHYIAPTAVGLTVVNTVLHPIVLSLKLQDLSLQVKTVPGSFLPTNVHFSGTVHPT